MGGYHPPTHTKDRLLLTILLNSGITIAEFVAGILSGYLALIADAVHNLSDVAALVLAWFGEKGGQLPATKKSTYGYKRLEVLTALVSAVALVVIAIFIFVEAYRRVIEPQPLNYPWLFMTVALIGLIGKGLSVWLLLSERSKSLNLKAAFLHLAWDTISSVIVIIGGVVILLTGWVTVDAILSVVIGVAILWSAYQVIREGTLILFEAVPASLDFDQVHCAITQIPRVRNVHDLHIWSLSSREVALSCHVCVAGADWNDAPEIVARIDQMLEARFHIGHATIQVERDDCARTTLLCSQLPK